MTSEIFLTVVIPVFNEEESLPHLCSQLYPVLESLEKKYEVIFVDDGSTDGSFETLRSLSSKYLYLRAVRFRRNSRKASALAAGFKEARGELIVTMDADLQDDPQEIPRLVDALSDKFDVVSGWKKKRHDPVSKTVPSRFFNFVTSLVSGLRLHDFNCGLKIYRREVCEDVLPYLYGELYRFLPAIAHWGGYRVGEIPVQHHPRRFGASKFGVRRLLNGFLDLMTITFIVRFMNTPMHIFGSLGLLSTLGGISICSYIAILHIEYGNIQSRHPLLLLGILLVIIGIQFFSTGLLSDMFASSQQRGGKSPRIAERI
ncbi:MAG: glycosyltransferase family 2 protein [Candidatus Latescibacterota bacterium]|nr:glycosyltransferase family 2 protein [Candidatus Latescibacterota bacterium]